MRGADCRVLCPLPTAVSQIRSNPFQKTLNLRSCVGCLLGAHVLAVSKWAGEYTRTIDRTGVPTTSSFTMCLRCCVPVGSLQWSVPDAKAAVQKCIDYAGPLVQYLQSSLVMNFQHFFRELIFVEHRVGSVNNSPI